MGLAWVRAQPPPDGLEVPAERAESGVEDDGIHRRDVEALDENRDADEHITLTRAERREGFRAVTPRRVAVDLPHAKAGELQALRGVRPFGYGLREHDGPEAPREPPHLGHRIAPLPLVARHDHLRRHEVPEVRQFADRRPLYEDVERVAHRRAVAPLRGRGVPEHASLRPEREDAHHARGGSMVTFVNDDAVDVGTLFARRESHRAPHLNRRRRVGLPPRLDDANAEPFGLDALRSVLK